MRRMRGVPCQHHVPVVPALVGHLLKVQPGKTIVADLPLQLVAVEVVGEDVLEARKTFLRARFSKPRPAQVSGVHSTMSVLMPSSKP